jgi:hypothetical protein
MTAMRITAFITLGSTVVPAVSIATTKGEAAELEELASKILGSS